MALRTALPLSSSSDHDATLETPMALIEDASSLRYFSMTWRSDINEELLGLLEIVCVDDDDGVFRTDLFALLLFMLDSAEEAVVVAVMCRFGNVPFLPSATNEDGRDGVGARAVLGDVPSCDGNVVFILLLAVYALRGETESDESSLTAKEVCLWTRSDSTDSDELSDNATDIMPLLNWCVTSERVRNDRRFHILGEERAVVCLLRFGEDTCSAVFAAKQSVCDLRPIYLFADIRRKLFGCTD
mmetsp:Transcript_15435/g.24336  ORF Transcript_15435/g.24336 Transcript_15435/m.24336 type:complete len:243 (+) Transcript_15435:550-1278(+)